MNINNLKPASAEIEMITQIELFKILNYNPYTGLFIWIKSTGRRVKLYEKAGWLETQGYTCIKINRMIYKAHRLAWLYMTGEFPENEIDHINLNRNDNRFFNLRKATRSQNKMNVYVRKDSLSGIKGIMFEKETQLWRARIQVRNKRLNLGRYKNINDAKKAYEEAAKKYFNEFARVD